VKCIFRAIIFRAKAQNNTEGAKKETDVFRRLAILLYPDALASSQITHPLTQVVLTILGHQMTVKSDRWIRQMAEEAQLIHPFEDRLVREVDGRRIISAGASSYGYDMRLADDGFRVFSPIHGREIDPKRFDESSLVEPPLQTAEDGSKYYLLPPHAYALGVTVETFHMPRNVTGICMGKSTYARAGLIVNTTPLEAGWIGRLVIELGNLADLPLRVYVNEGIGQVVFLESDEDCDVSYEDRGGKYQGQTGLTYSRL
jgi:dCTP deaminase